MQRHLSHVPDLDKIAAKFHRVSAMIKANANGKKSKSYSTVAGIEDLVRIYNCILSASGLLRELHGYQGNFRAELLDQFATPFDLACRDFEGFVMLVEQTIDLAEAVKNRKYMINPRLDAEFMNLADAKFKCEQAMQDIATGLQNSLKLAANECKIIDNPRHGKVLRTTKKQQKKVSGHKGVIQVQLNKNEYQFTTQEFKLAVTKYDSAQRRYEKEQSLLVNKALEVAASYYPIIERLSLLYGTLDVLCSFALVSKKGIVIINNAKIRIFKQCFFSIFSFKFHQF